MIFDQEHVITTGKAYKFKTRPIDPSDPFKGKYIHLNYDINSVPTNDSTWFNYEPIFISLTTDSLGYAMVKKVARQKPDNSNYIKAEVNWYNAYKKEVNFSIPFDEFYMNENKAYDAELAYMEAQRDTLPNNTYALVYVLNGVGVMDNVFIDDIPIAKYVEKEQ